MSNDFRALLSNFQSATGDCFQHSDVSGSKERSLKELTTNLWRRSQLRQSVQLLSTKTSTSAGLDKSGNDHIHLAICLCIVDSLTHVDVWEDWSRDNKDSHASANLYVHAKLPEKVTHPWVRSKLITISHRPSWNDVRIVKAMLSLIEEALKDPRTTHVVFGTESCIPICPLDQVHMEHGKSYVPYYGKSQATRFDERDVWDALRQHIPLDAIHKALPGWCTLARDHAQRILDMPAIELGGKDLWPAFESCWAPEEAYFPTALALLGLLSETRCKSFTYAEWETHQSRASLDKAHPRDWDGEFDGKLVDSLRRIHGCIILRKLKFPVELSHWRHAVVDQALTRKRIISDQEPNLACPQKKKTRM